jgi:hypothetical protein
MILPEYTVLTFKGKRTLIWMYKPMGRVIKKM